MSKHLVIGDSHAHYKHNNDRAIWLGRLIRDTKPDVVINLGDTGDLPSLSGYDKGTRAAVGRTYRQDIEAHNDFQEKLWSTVRKGKKKLPRRVTLIGNHEQRIDRALDSNQALQGAIGYEDLHLDDWYDTVVHYKGGTPGTITLDGILYAHYLVSGVSGRSLGGEHIGHSILSKQHTSCVVGHNHLLDYCVRTAANGKKIMALSAGCFFDYEADWAGEMNKLYWRGVCILHNVNQGTYDLETVSIDRIKRDYGRSS